MMMMMMMLLLLSYPALHAQCIAVLPLCTSAISTSAPSRNKVSTMSTLMEKKRDE